MKGRQPQSRLPLVFPCAVILPVVEEAVWLCHKVLTGILLYDIRHYRSVVKYSSLPHLQVSIIYGIISGVKDDKEKK